MILHAAPANRDTHTDRVEHLVLCFVALLDADQATWAEGLDALSTALATGLRMVPAADRGQLAEELLSGIRDSVRASLQ